MFSEVDVIVNQKFVNVARIAELLWSPWDMRTCNNKYNCFTAIIQVNLC